MFSDRIVSINFTANGVRRANNADVINGYPSSKDIKLASTSECSRGSKPTTLFTRLQRKLSSSACRCSSKSYRRRRSSKSLLATITPRAINVRSFASKCCPCPCPSCPCPACCGTLPPPCNQPPRCIQCMTGYYYYPYGYWFCGPYHVTGQCCPVGPCGICPKPCCSACVCPSAAAAVMPAFDQTPNASSSEPVEAPSHKLSHQTSMTSVSESGARKAGRASISNFFPFPADQKKERRSKSGPSRKVTNPTLQSSFFCLPYQFKTSTDPIDASKGADRASHSRQNVQVRVDTARHHSNMACSCKCCKYMDPVTSKDTSDKVKNLDKLMDSKL